MDIDAALERLRELAAADPDSEWAIAFEAMDGWLSRGGFFPDAWRHPDPRTQYTYPMEPRKRLA